MTRTAVVTGAGSGIGQATVESLTRQEWHVVALDQNAQVNEIFEGSSSCVTMVGDISDPVTAGQAVELAMHKFGKLDALANVAGVTRVDDNAIEDLEFDVFDSILAVNLRGTFSMCRAAMPPLKRGGGAIVNVSSVSATRGMGGTAYGVSKAGLLGLTRNLAYQGASFGVRCNAVLPGPIDTPMIRLGEAKGAVVANVPGTIPGKGSPQDVGELIAFLLGEFGSFITGSTYAIDGGISKL